MHTNDDFLTLTHTGDEYEKYLGAVVPPVFMNSLHVFPDFEAYLNFDDSREDSFIYGRESNPTVHILERKIAELEHGSMALAFASGMAAATAAVMATCRAGSHIICMHNTYGPLKQFIKDYCGKNFQMTVTFLQGTDLQELEAAIRPETDLIILESPATFVFTVVDLAAIAQIAKKHHVKTYMDNSWSTPLYQKPLDFGIDIVMHTMSKYLGGHSDLIGGVLVSKDQALMESIMHEERALYGGILGPMEAWLVIRGMRSLPARLAMHQETAMKVAAYLEQHPKVSHVYYTGLKSNPQRELIERQQTGHTGLMSFILDAPVEKVPFFIDQLRVFKIGCSWGGFESLALAPLYKTPQEELDLMGVPEGKKLIRIHCGLEGADALIQDLDQALHAV
ncbi:MAG: trans-sulfuration enzyme family protein [Hominenteromicrobium sp.]